MNSTRNCLLVRYHIRQLAKRVMLGSIQMKLGSTHLRLKRYPASTPKPIFIIILIKVHWGVVSKINIFRNILFLPKTAQPQPLFPSFLFLSVHCNVALGTSNPCFEIISCQKELIAHSQVFEK